MAHKNGFWAKLNHFVDFHRKLCIWLSVGMFVVAAVLVALGYYFQPKPLVQAAAPKQTSPTQTVVNGVTTYYSPLTGVQVPDANATKREVTAVMIENSPDARPQSGIKPAGVVFEAIAEGGITRFLTLHQEDRPGLIGPVRSLRPYYIDWLAPFDASVAHVGGSYNALQTVRNGSFKDIDQFFNGNYYWRATDRIAPHNVYSNFDKLDALNASKGYTTSNFTGWPRKTDSPMPTPNASKINVTISSALYNSNYAYDAASNSYRRSEGGAPHNDREAGQISPKVVVIIKVPTQLGFEDGWREQMSTIGTNQAYIFQDGTETDGIWRKDSQKAQLAFYDKSGHPIAFNSGQTWIAVTAPENTPTWQ